jgi:arsenate reductase-like glutaredoxin family protein
VVLSERDFFKEPFSEQELRELVATASVQHLFSWRSPAVKKLEANPATLSDDELIDLMLNEPRLIRRPMIKLGTTLIVGANPKDLARLQG